MLNSKVFNYYSSIVGASSLFSLQSSAINWDFENLGESLRTCQVSGEGGGFSKGVELCLWGVGNIHLKIQQETTMHLGWWYQMFLKAIFIWNNWSGICLNKVSDIFT